MFLNTEQRDLYYKMMYCDYVRCLVNTFEHGPEGSCPGCGNPGIELQN